MGDVEDTQFFGFSFNPFLFSGFSVVNFFLTCLFLFVYFKMVVLSCFVLSMWSMQLSVAFSQYHIVIVSISVCMKRFIPVLITLYRTCVPQGNLRIGLNYGLSVA